MSVHRDPGSLIEVKVGETFCVIVPSTPTSGYTWIGNTSYDDALLQRVATHTLGPTTDAAGEAVEESFEFRAAQAGATTITLNYQREWQATPRETRVFRVRIRE